MLAKYLSILKVLTVSSCFAAAGAALTYITGFHRPFSLTDDAIAYPLRPNIVSLSVVAVISIIGPAAVIAIVNLGAALLGRSTTSQHDVYVSRRDRMAAVAWEIHAACLGLCTGLAATLFITAGLKDMVGKPRPDLLARCNPDLTNISRYVVGGFGINLDSEASPLVSSAICQQIDKRLLDDGFASFPSGHASFNSAGMVYLTLWLCARWRVTIPFLNYTQHKRSKMSKAQSMSAAPPLWQVALAFTPIFVALFVCSSRYADFHHAGFDIIAGAVLGTTIGWASFRLYHLPIRRSKGLLAWSPRPDDHAFMADGKNDDDIFDEEQGSRAADVELNPLKSDSPAPLRSGGSIPPLPKIQSSRPSRREGKYLQAKRLR